MSQYTLEILVKAIDEASKQLKDTDEALGLVGDRAKTVGKALLGLSAAGTGLIVSSTLTAARTEELGGVLQVVAGNAGYTQEQIAYYEERVKSMGITTQATRQALTQMAQANIDYAYAADLARLSQDAAVIAQLDSSEAFERLISATQRGEIEMLRTMGITVDFQGAYKKLADELGVSVDALDDQQRVQARVNEVMAQGAAIAGTYEGAMDSAGKRMRSMSRHVQEAKASLGEAFLPMMGQAVDTTTNMLKAFNKLEPGQKEFIGNTLAIGSAVAGTGGAMLLAAPKIAALGTALTGTTVAASAVLAPMAAVVAVVAAATAAIKLYADTQAAHTEVNNAWTKMLEDQVASGASATEVMNEYRAAQEGVNRAYEEAAWYAKPFIDQQEISTASAEELQQAILDASQSFEDYNAAMDNLTQTTAVTERAMTQFEWATLKAGGRVEYAAEETDVMSMGMIRAQEAAERSALGIDNAANAADEAIGPFGGLVDTVTDLGQAFTQGIPNADQMWALILQTERAAGATAEQLGDMAVMMGVATNEEVAAQLAMYTMIDAYNQGERSMREVAGAANLMEQHTASLAEAERLEAEAAREAEAGHTAEAAALTAQAEAERQAAQAALDLAIQIAETGQAQQETAETADELTNRMDATSASLGRAANEAATLQRNLSRIEREIEVRIDIQEHYERTGERRGGSTGAVAGYQHGLAYVPYDDFPAILHKGERVLTAQENREYNDNRNFGGNKTEYHIYNPMAAAILADEQQREKLSRLEGIM